MTNMNPAVQQRDEITVKFSRKLVGEPFMAKTGRECVSIRIPNADPADKRPWETIVVAANHVHEDKFSDGVWMKLLADGETKVSRSEISGKTEDGRNTYASTTRMVPNGELKSMLEVTRPRTQQYNRTSVTDALKQPAVAGPAKPRAAGMER